LGHLLQGERDGIRAILDQKSHSFKRHNMMDSEPVCRVAAQQSERRSADGDVGWRNGKRGNLRQTVLDFLGSLWHQFAAISRADRSWHRVQTVPEDMIRRPLTWRHGIRSCPALVTVTVLNRNLYPWGIGLKFLDLVNEERPNAENGDVHLPELGRIRNRSEDEDRKEADNKGAADAQLGEREAQPPETTSQTGRTPLSGRAGIPRGRP
jgi:hypothetical protein